MNTITIEPGIHAIPAADYYADPCETPSLTQSTANAMLNFSPRHAWLWHPKLGNQRRRSTGSMDNGTILHSLILEDGMPENIVLLPFDDFRTKAAQTMRDEVIEEGRIPLLERMVAEHQRTANRIRQTIEQLGFSLEGEKESVAIWNEKDEDGHEVGCRARLDILRRDDGSAVITDLKTTAASTPDECVKSMMRYGYDLQQAAYTSAIENLYPDLAGRVEFINLFIQSEGDGAVLPFRPGGAMRALGNSKWRRAISLWSRCLRTNNWPNTIEAIPPRWAMTAEYESSSDSQLGFYIGG